MTKEGGAELILSRVCSLLFKVCCGLVAPGTTWLQQVEERNLKGRKLKQKSENISCEKYFGNFVHHPATDHPTGSQGTGTFYFIFSFIPPSPRFTESHHYPLRPCHSVASRPTRHLVSKGGPRPNAWCRLSLTRKCAPTPPLFPPRTSTTGPV